MAQSQLLNMQMGEGRCLPLHLEPFICSGSLKMRKYTCTLKLLYRTTNCLDQIGFNSATCFSSPRKKTLAI